MKAVIELRSGRYGADLSKPIDISIAVGRDAQTSFAFSLPPARFTPRGAVSPSGGSCNYDEIVFTPHGNGTHTECVGHIDKHHQSILQCLKRFFFLSKLLSVNPSTAENGDRIVLPEQLTLPTPEEGIEALIVRTLPNGSGKTSQNYSEKNPPYLHCEAARRIAAAGIRHLLVDLPSIDREDDPQLLAHRAFWNYPSAPRNECTITELIYVPSAVPDGAYLLNLQIAGFESDATPSKPVLYSLLP